MTDPLAPLVVLVLADDDTVASALRERLPGHALRVEQGRLAEVADRCDRERYAAIVVDARRWRRPCASPRPCAPRPGAG